MALASQAQRHPVTKQLGQLIRSVKFIKRLLCTGHWVCLMPRPNTSPQGSLPSCRTVSFYLRL